MAPRVTRAARATWSSVVRVTPRRANMPRAAAMIRLRVCSASFLVRRMGFLQNLHSRLIVYNQRSSRPSHSHFLNGSPMARLRSLIVLMFLGVLLAGCGSSAPEGKGDAKAASAEPGKASKDAKGKGAPGGGAAGAVPARVLQVQPQRIPVRLDAVAQVEGSKEVEIRARVGG